MTRILHRVIGANYPTAVGGEGIELIDSDGRRYIDASGGAAVSCLGHGHPDVRAALQAMSAGDCPALEARMRERFQQIVDSYSARDREYDRQTDHGRTQGAVF